MPNPGPSAHARARLVGEWHQAGVGRCALGRGAGGEMQRRDQQPGAGHQTDARRRAKQGRAFRPGAVAQLRAFIPTHLPWLDAHATITRLEFSHQQWKLDYAQRHGLAPDHDAAVTGMLGLGTVYGLECFFGPDGPGGGGGGFRGPAAKGFDWEHIIDHHAPWGSVAKQRVAQGIDESIFENMSEQQIRASVQEAWRHRNRVRTQLNPATGETRVLYSGQDARSGYTIEMWYNQNTGIVETAYPIGRRK